MFLLDTNALIIFLHDELTKATLSKTAIDIIQSEDTLYVSIASLWEIAVKVSIGKLALRKPISVLEDGCKKQGISIIPIKSIHLDTMIKLPMLKDHKDPFDRLILATSISEHMALISTDHKMRQTEYGADIIC